MQWYRYYYARIPETVAKIMALKELRNIGFTGMITNTIKEWG